MTGVAVNVTGVPKQIELVDAAIDTAGVTDADTVIVMAPDATDAGLAHDSEEVISQITTSPLFNEELL